ncbi:hypothetical protein [Streptomyces sp. JJ38]|uniref:hypothetical protein n=1 Tax=Streptomyces sp. JJ38 TaxID=2738128 RepID=UPI001C5632A3|nr:hypothetical protein [Streptomyces sp. JJ38]MBW1597220.1 hypothetical protein [Streptomyces sp. JJ38]
MTQRDGSPGSSDDAPVLLMPPQLRHLDGDPLAAFAARVWRTLTGTGIPVYLLTDDDPPRPYGVTLALISSSRADGAHLQLGWNLPREPSGSDDTPEAAQLLRASTVLTYAVAGILTAYGYQLSTEEPGLPWPPFLNVYPDGSSA